MKDTMTSCTAPSTPTDVNVGMGQIAAAQSPDRLKAVLGSCVGVAVFHPRFPIGVMAHVVLPDSAGRGGPAGKFADTAVSEMLRVLDSMGVARVGRVAKIAGGAQMFAISGPIQVGEANVEAVRRVLAREQIPIIGQDVGGASGRRVVFDCASGRLLVEVVGQPSRHL